MSFEMSDLLKPAVRPDETGADAATIWSRVREHYLHKHEKQSRGESLGPVFLTPELTNMMGGYAQVGLHLWQGKPGAGKSAAVLQCAIANTDSQVLYITAEMSESVIAYRMIAHVTGIKLSELFTGKMPPDAFTKAVNDTEAKTKHIAVIDLVREETALTLARLEARITELRPAKPHMLIILDSFHSWASSLPTSKDEREHYDALLDGLRSLAARHEVVFFVLVERNRTNTSGGLSAASGTRRFEYCADGYLDLDVVTRVANKWKPEKGGDEELEDVGELTPVDNTRYVRIAARKNRYARYNCCCVLAFDGATQRFTATNSAAASRDPPSSPRPPKDTPKSGFRDVW